MQVNKTVLENMAAVQLRSDTLEVVVVPGLGGKMISFRHIPTDRQWLWREGVRSLRPATYADGFAQYEVSGFDECFPSIGECAYPEPPFEGEAVPDHGEIWSLPWEAVIEPDALVMRVQGVRFPYIFEKRITLLGGGRCKIRYMVTNQSSADIKCVWTAHPLFIVERGMLVLLPGTPRLTPEFCISGDRVQPDQASAERRWPLVTGQDGHEHNLSELPFDAPVLDKVFAGPLDAGWCALWSPDSGDYVGVAFDRTLVPMVGVCVNLGYPSDGNRPGYWVALEPSTGSTDRLDLSVQRGNHQTLPAKGSLRWDLVLVAGNSLNLRGFAVDGTEA